MADEAKKTNLARSLRTRMTAAERKLWSKLRNRRLSGLVFNRQQPIGPYIADYYCSAARLVIELDGSAHAWRKLADDRRDRWMDEEGIRVLRFSNGQIMFDLDTVLAEIKGACAGCLPDVLTESANN